LFDQERRQKQARLDAVKDKLKDLFGADVLRRGSSLGNQGKRKPGEK
jgi:hypothetical protein